MEQTETAQILDYLRHIYESINGPLPEASQAREEPPLTTKVGALTTRVGSLETKVDALGKKVGGLEKKVGGLEKKVGGLEKKVGGLEKSVGKLDDRVSEVQLGLATLTADTTDRFKKVDGRFDSADVQFRGVRGAIESTRVQLVDLVGRVHSELTGRIIDVEVPGPGGRGGGGRGSGGVPLAS